MLRLRYGLAAPPLPVHRMGVVVNVTVEPSMTSAVPSASCPKCGETNVQSVPINRSSVPEAVAAEYFRGTGGSAQGADTILQSVCGRCGCHWIPRTTEERHLRALSGQLGPEAMRAAQAENAAAGAKVRRRIVLPKVPKQTVVIAVVMVIVILLALLT